MSVETVTSSIENAGVKLAKAVKREMTLEDDRINHKMAAIERIMAAGDNKLTGKPHSFSSAEALVNSDPAYADYLEQLRNAAEERIIARAGYDAAVVGGYMQARVDA